jgi:signal transduction histidine kinase
VKPLSLKFRLSILVSLVLLIVIITVSSVAYVEMEESLLINIDRTLKAMGNGILAELGEPESPEHLLEDFRTITNYKLKERSTRFRIWQDGSETNLFISDPLSSEYGRLLLDLPEEKRPALDQFTLFNINGNSNPYRAIWMRSSSKQGVFNILVLHSSQYAYHEMREFLQMLLILGGSALLAVLIFVPLIIFLVMRPLEGTAATLEQITYKNLTPERLNNVNIPQEVKPFVGAVRDMLARLNQNVQQQKRFTADAAHELRTPLALIKSTLQTARLKDREVPEYKQAMDDTLEDVDRMQRLMDQLLSLARMDEIEEIRDPEPVDLNILLGELAAVFDAQAQQHGGRVICETIPTVRVKGSETELSQLFQNLLENALRYGPPQGTVRITAQNDSEDSVTVCIHDEGGQLPPEALPHVFERFYRVDASRNRATGGNGLGLSIAREIVLCHQGEISITSDPDSGTSVFVRLPAW